MAENIITTVVLVQAKKIIGKKVQVLENILAKSCSVELSTENVCK